MKKVLAVVALAVVAVGALSMKAPERQPQPTKMEQAIDARLHELLTRMNARHAAQ